MVIDTSAIGAILLLEPEGRRFEDVIVNADRRLISAVTRMEMSCVFESVGGRIGREKLEQFLFLIDPEIVPVDLRQMTLAIEAYRTFGKGRHKAALNIGDCFAYALAKLNNEALLFKGNDFALTDIAAA